MKRGERYTTAYTTFGIKASVSPEVPNNEGSFRPVTVTAPEGCILNAVRPAPLAARHIVGHLAPIALFGAAAYRPLKYFMAIPAASVFLALVFAAYGARRARASKPIPHAPGLTSQAPSLTELSR